jgi:hypothetical protein
MLKRGKPRKAKTSVAMPQEENAAKASWETQDAWANL